MSTLNDPEFSGRHLREVLRQRPDVCATEHYQDGLLVVHDAGVQLAVEAVEADHADVPAPLTSGAMLLTQGTAEQLLAFIACFEKPAERMPALALR